MDPQVPSNPIRTDGVAGFDTEQAMQQMMFNDFTIPNAGRVRWLWRGSLGACFCFHSIFMLFWHLGHDFVWLLDFF